MVQLKHTLCPLQKAVVIDIVFQISILGGMLFSQTLLSTHMCTHIRIYTFWGCGTIHQVQNLAGDKLCLHSPMSLNIISLHYTATHVMVSAYLLGMCKYIQFYEASMEIMVSLLVTLAHHSCIFMVCTSPSCEPLQSWTVCQPFLSSSALDLLTAKFLHTRTLTKPCPLGNHGNYIETNSRQLPIVICVYMYA